jgi:hypothetical protein
MKIKEFKQFFYINWLPTGNQYWNPVINIFLESVELGSILSKKIPCMGWNNIFHFQKMQIHLLQNKTLLITQLVKQLVVGNN